MAWGAFDAVWDGSDVAAGVLVEDAVDAAGSSVLLVEDDDDKTLVLLLLAELVVLVEGPWVDVVSEPLTAG